LTRSPAVATIPLYDLPWDDPLSQYPSPYSPPPYSPGFGNTPPGPDPLGPARRAAILLFVLGAFGMLLGLCFGPMVWVLPIDQAFAQSGVRPPENLPSGVTLLQTLRIAYTVVLVVMFLAGAMFTLLGFFVRRGSRRATITACVFSGLALLWFGLNAAGSLVMGLSGNPMAFLGTAMNLVPFGLFGLLLSWLLQVLKRLPQMQLARQQQEYYYQQQAQYPQMQQPYPQAPPGSGYGPPAGYGQEQAAPQWGQAPASPGYGAQPPSSQAHVPNNTGSVRHPPLPPSPGDPEGPFGNSPQG
jgi:hypothetical protein